MIMLSVLKVAALLFFSFRVVAVGVEAGSGGRGRKRTRFTTKGGLSLSLLHAWHNHK